MDSRLHGNDGLVVTQRKASRTHTHDPQSGQIVSLFNPATERWFAHFQWSGDGAEMIGLTAMGRATIEALQLNRPLLVKSR